MSWVEKPPSGRYRAKYRDNDGRQHSRTFSTRTAAKAFLQTTGADMQRGQWVDPRGGQKLFRDWGLAWFGTRVVRPSTRHADRGRLPNHLLPEFGDEQLKEITPLRVRSWVAGLTQRRAPGTVRHCHALLSQILDDAIVAGLLLTNPCRSSRLPRNRTSIAQCLSPEDVQRLIDVVDPHYRPLVVVAATTGMRWGELVGLRPEYVDLLHRKLRVAETLVEVGGVLNVGQPKTPRSTRTILAGPRDAVIQEVGTLTRSPPYRSASSFAATERPLLWMQANRMVGVTASVWRGQLNGW